MVATAGSQRTAPACCSIESSVRLLPWLAVHRISRVIADGPEPAVAEEEFVLLVFIERAGAYAAEDRDLVAALIDGPIAVEPLRQGQGLAAVRNRIGGDE